MKPPLPTAHDEQLTVSRRTAYVDGIRVRWTIADGWDSVVLGNDAPKWHLLENDARAVRVKENAKRTVWRIRTNQHDLHVKELKPASSFDRVKQWIRGSEARIEWEAAAQASGFGVACPKCIAYAVTPNGSFLLSVTIPDVSSLDDAWLAAAASPNHARDTAALTNAVAALLAHAHDRGFYHGDDHPRNILVKSPGTEAVYTDLRTARTTENASDDNAIHSLAQMAQWFRTRTTRKQRLRFLVAYCRLRSETRSDARAMLLRMASPIKKEADRQSARLWSKRDRRILRSNAYFRRLRTGNSGTVWTAHRIRQPSLYPPPEGDLRSDEDWASYFVHECSARTHELRFHAKGIGDRLSWIIFGSPARRAFVAGHRLRNRDLPARIPLACWEWRSECAVVFQTSPETRSIGELDQTEHQRLREPLARLVEMMSERGVTLNATAPDALGVAMPDLQIIIDRPDAVRFLRPLTPREWKQEWRTVARSETKES
jgi:tRNA A-37 threonylcarbamoyl transferase component Bud32